MIEAAMLWNEPNNRSHWDFSLDPDWSLFAEMTKRAAARIRGENPALPLVLGGLSPIDPDFVRNMSAQGVLSVLDAMAVHGFPLDWNHWPLADWPRKLEEVREVTTMPLWVSEVGVSSFGAEEVRGGCRASTGTASMTCRRPGRPPRGTAKRKAPPTTGTSTWACCGKTVPRSSRSSATGATHRT
jgi:beta-xylosidase